jgi:hypothetical protein
VLRHLLLSRGRLAGAIPSQQQGWALIWAMVAGVVLVVGTLALSSRTSQGLISSLFQGVNIEARDVAENAISDFGVTMNQENNRRLLVAGNDSTWTDSKHRNPCTASTQNSDGTWTTLSADNAVVEAASKPVSATRFKPSETWQQLSTGDTTRSFKVTKVEYLYENAAGERTPFNFAGANDNFLGKTVRESALEGGTRVLVRVMVVGRVVRDGQTSYARVAREYEVVPKCCKRSFGNNIGAVAWGRDTADCPVKQDRGVGNGLIGSLDGGSPQSSNNQLDIRDENNKIITQALCWSGNDPDVPSDLDGTPNPACLNNEQTLGASSKNKSGVSFLPTSFSLKLPDPRFNQGGQWGTASSTTSSLLDAAYPDAAVGTWIAQGVSPNEEYWMRRFVDGGSTEANWILFSARTLAYSASPPSDWRFDAKNASLPINCNLNSYLADISLCMWRVSSSPFPRVTPVSASSASYGSTTRIYLDPRDFKMKQQVGTTITDMDNCMVSRDPGAPYAVVHCNFSQISAGNREVIIDTSYAMINFYFTNLAVTGDYMGGNGNTTYKRVHCPRPASSSSWSPTNCNTVLPWAKSGSAVFDYQTKCDPDAANKDPNCTVKNSKYDSSELWNAFTDGAGLFSLKGTSQSVGINVYAPNAKVELIGGGNADPNFMGRIWTNVIKLNGNVKLRVPTSMAGFCTEACPPDSKVSLFDVVARSFSYASGF